MPAERRSVVGEAAAPCACRELAESLAGQMHETLVVAGLEPHLGRPVQSLVGVLHSTFAVMKPLSPEAGIVIGCSL